MVHLLNISSVKAGMHSFAPSSVLKQGKFVKIRIKESGVYKLTYSDLQNMGINPSQVRIFGYGGAMLNQSFNQPKYDDLPEIPVYMDKGTDGVFNSGDYILFYAQGVVSWRYDSSRQMFVHTNNYYSNYGYYFVTSDAGEGRKIEGVDRTLPSDATAYEMNSFIDYQVHEKELVSLSNTGRELFGETFSDNVTLNLDFTFPNILKTANAVRFRLDVAASASALSYFNLSADQNQVGLLSVAKKTENDHYEKGRAAAGLYNYTPSADLIKVRLDYAKPNVSAKGYLNFLEINAKRSLIMTGNVMQFQHTEYLGTNTYNRYTLSNASVNTQIWDITDHVNVQRVNAPVSGNSLSFYSSNSEIRTYLAINPSSSFPKPDVIGEVPNQNLHAMKSADMIIITHPNFLQQANRLAKAHNDKGEIVVDVVTTEQVYNEFSSGTPDGTAYRWLMKMFYDRAMDAGKPSERPRNLLLFGRGSFDNREILTSTKNKGFVLTYQAEHSLNETLSYVTDDYFTFLEDSEGTQISAHTMDIGVGRFPVSTVQEATDVVNKTINYMKNENRGAWKNQICFLADDGDSSLHMKQADSISSMIGRAHPGYQYTKIYLDAYQQEVTASGESYPVARTQFHNMLNNGMFILNFIGHANASGWTNEQILTTNDVRNLSNENLPLWIGATCNFLQFDLPNVSAGEHVLLNPVGGGIGIVSAARPVYASQNLNINKMLMHYLFTKDGSRKNMSLGEAMMRTKNYLGNESNKLSYVLMGDPSLKLNYPDQYFVTTEEINGLEAAESDTLRALSVATFKGKIVDVNGQHIEDFNGTVSATVFDKEQSIMTLDNDKNYPEDQKSMTYKDRPNKLFSGVTNVVDGEFELTFMLPKDIKYNYGLGRINYYATSQGDGPEAQGYYEKFTIGGSNPYVIEDEDGPDITMYLNAPDFVSGGKVNETPVFIANVHDINGINQVGSGIGHDITLVVDEDPNQTYILNDYFKSVENDYTQGSIRYKLPELKQGKHTLTFKVWDLLNNSSSETIEFEVVKGLEPQIFSIMNYPNPVKSFTKFKVNHDRPETVLNIQLSIYDLSGRQIWTINQSTLSEINWDLTDVSGVRIPKGVYLYRASIHLNDKSVHSKVNKLIVVE